MFQRWQSSYVCSRAYARFKAHHTEINRYYWSFVPAASYVKHIQRHSPPSTTAELFHASGPNVRRLDPAAAAWAANFREFENWTRLSVLLSALSYLETYMSTIVTLALRSDPLLRFGQSRAVDGAAWVKRSVSDDVSNLVAGCTKGEWSKRIANYRRLFGMVPQRFAAQESDLERMRSIRNGVAHGFGRELRHFHDPISLDGNKAERLSEQVLLRWLGSIEQAGIAIDEHLLEAHVGDFELLWHFHRWHALPRAEKEPKYIESTAFSRFLNRTFGSTPGRDHCRQLEKYYYRI